MENTDTFVNMIVSEPVVLFLKIMFSITIGLLLKDLATKIAAGVIFYFDRNFNEGDQVFLDGEKATIVKMGPFTSVFMVENGRGTVWRYIPNDRIKYSKLEKVICPKKTGD
jgi:hypothetical protein